MDTYHELRAEGLPFSEQYQSDRPPVLDPGGGSLLDRPSAAGGRSMAASSRAGNGDSGDGGRPGGGPGETGVGAAQETSGPHELRELSGEGVVEMWRRGVWGLEGGDKPGGGERCGGRVIGKCCVVVGVGTIIVEMTLTMIMILMVIL